MITQEQALLALYGVLLVVAVLVVGSILVRAIRRRRLAARRRDRVWAVGRANPRADDDARAAAAIEAFVAGADVDAQARRRPPPAWEASRRQQDEVVAPDREAPDREAPAVRRLPVHRALAGHAPSTVPQRPVADATTWSRAIREESVRVARFGHDATVVMLEVPRLQVLADRLGGGVADRVATEAARVLASETRAVDRIARLGEARFGILLLETDEGAAGGYVERVRAATDRWLESTGLSIRVSYGWASPAEGDSLMAAAATAEQRMHHVGHGPRTVGNADDQGSEGVRSVPGAGVGWP